MNSSSSKYQLIYDLISQDDGHFSVTELCKLAHVSRSGYYNWIAQSDFRAHKEAQDRADFNLILQVFNKRGYKKGAKSIHMALLHETPSVRMNVKKIRRLMHKYGLVCPIRKVNPYRELAKARQESHVAPNVLERQFQAYGPRKVLLTDITYIPMSDGFLYLSVVMDAYTKQVLAYEYSDNLKIDFVLRTFQKLLNKHGKELSPDTIVHSDQGSHYTSLKFIELLKDASLTQSMSRRGNCWDNAPQESFFGHMKAEAEFESCKTLQDCKDRITDWIDYYNNDRYQWRLAKLSPNEYYDYVITNNYPIKEN